MKYFTRYDLLKGGSGELFQDCVKDVSDRCDDGEVWGRGEAYLYIFDTLAFRVPKLFERPRDSRLTREHELTNQEYIFPIDLPSQNWKVNTK